MTGISEEKLLEIVYNTTLCFIRTDELTDEQLNKLDNITYSLCDCPMCSGRKTFPRPLKAIGHADERSNSISISRNAIKEMAGLDELSRRQLIWSMPAFLLQFIVTILHEIIHILFAEYNEEEVNKKTVEWLNSFDWSEFVYFWK